jgi:GcrA cell cycle regulator
MIDKTVWTPQLDARLRELHGQGLIFLQIAAAMNDDFGLALTRNACIGRSRRIGIGMRTTPPPPRNRKAPKLVRKPRPPRPIAPPIVPEPAPVPGALTMLQLSRTTCHWPSGNRPPYTYCGEPVHGDRPFCLDHCKLAYQKPEKTWT